MAKAKPLVERWAEDVPEQFISSDKPTKKGMKAVEEYRKEQAKKKKKKSK